MESQFVSEESRTHHYLSPQTAAPLQQLLKENLLTINLEAIVSKESGLDSMIDSNKMGDLSRLYSLYTLVSDGLPCIKQALKRSIARRGKDINEVSLSSETLEDPTDAKEKGKTRVVTAGAQTLTSALKWVQDVLELKDKFDTIWKNAFQSDREIEATLNEVSAYSRRGGAP